MTVCTGVSIDDIREAEERLDGRVVRTPLIESRLLNDRLQSRVLFKTECLQKTGSFKIRGALNKLSLLTEHERAAGVVAYSSGNHVQGVAAAAKLKELPAVIVMTAAGLFVAGHTLAGILSISTEETTWVSESLVTAFRWLVPDLARFDMRLHALHGQAVPGLDIGLSWAYGVAYAGAVLAFAWVAFHRRDLK